MANWTTPKTFAEDEVLTYLDVNTYLSDNTEFLFDRPSDEYVVDGGTDYTTTSTTFVDVDATNLKLEITSGGSHLLVHGHIILSNVSVSAYVYLDIEVNGVRQGGQAGIVGMRSVSANDRTTVTFSRLLDLPADDYEIKLQWRVSAGTAKMYNGDAAAANLDFEGQFWVHEI